MQIQLLYHIFGIAYSRNIFQHRKLAAILLCRWHEEIQFKVKLGVDERVILW